MKSRPLVTIIAALTILLNLFAVPASASGTVWIYSPVTNKNWWYSQLNHPGFLGATAARDVTRGGVWTSDEDVTFTTAGLSVSAYVETARDNCATWDKYAILQLWVGSSFYGKVGYVHLRTLSVTEGSWISSGTILGKIQNQSDACWTGIHVHMEQQSGTWTWSACPTDPTTECTYQEFTYATPVLQYNGGGPQSPLLQKPLPADLQLRQRAPVK